MIEIFHQNGARVVADIVINHGNTMSNDPCQFAEVKFGSYGTFQPDPSWICNTDEMNWDSKKSDMKKCFGLATGNADDGYGNDANYDSAPDWDHKNSDVRAMFEAYLRLSECNDELIYGLLQIHRTSQQSFSRMCCEWFRCAAELTTRHPYVTLAMRAAKQYHGFPLV